MICELFNYVEEILKLHCTSIIGLKRHDPKWIFGMSPLFQTRSGEREDVKMAKGVEEIKEIFE